MKNTYKILAMSLLCIAPTAYAQSEPPTHEEVCDEVSRTLSSHTPAVLKTETLRVEDGELKFEVTPGTLVEEVTLSTPCPPQTETKSTTLILLNTWKESRSTSNSCVLFSYGSFQEIDDEGDPLGEAQVVELPSN